MSDLYDLAPRRRTRRRLLVGAAVLALVAAVGAALVLLRDRPADQSVTPAAAAATAGPGRPVQTGRGGPAADVVTDWAIPASGVGGPARVTGAGVPQGYSHDAAGATKAGLNAVVAAVWMRHVLPDPWTTLQVLVVPADVRGGVYTDELRTVFGGSAHLTSVDEVATGSGPIGGRALAVHAQSPKVTGSWETSVVVVLWEQFTPASNGTRYDVQIVPFTVQLAWYADDWLVFGFQQAAPDPAAMPELSVGQVPSSLPLPAESWYS